MAHPVIVALDAERLEVLRVAKSLTEDEWHLESDCEGWAVRDVLAHMLSLFHINLGTVRVVAENRDTDEPEKVNDALVDMRARLSPAELLGNYEVWSRRAVRLMALLQRRPLANIAVNMGGLGTYELRMLANATVFDHYLHLRYDILKPTGPIDRPQPPHDDLRLDPTLEWCMQGIPQMSGTALHAVDAPVALDLGGPGGGTWIYEPPRGGETTGAIAPSDLAGAAATIRSTSDDFLVWGTRRRDWHTLEVEIDGDKDLAERFLDNVNII